MTTSTDLTDFLASLAGRRSPRTIAGYGHDLTACAGLVRADAGPTAHRR